MSIIDSGLGWSCDSDYYVDTANTILYVNTSIPATSYKNNNGAAICATLKLSADNNYRMFILSSISDYAKNHEIYDGTPSSAETIYTVTIDSNIWYISEVGHNYNTYDTNIFVCGGEADAVSCNISDFRNGRNDARKNIIESILSSANVQFIKHIPTTDYVKAFVEGVEAETAERVNALQPKTMSSAVSVGGVSQSTVESVIGAMASRISKIDFDIHRDLGTEITAAQKLAIANGTFEDLPIGAYWTLNNTVYRIAHHDYYLGTGDTACTSHHIVVVPDNWMYSAKMNSTDTTVGGYVNSEMRTTDLVTALSTFETDFGSAHILNHRIKITNAVSNGQASGWAWVDSKVDLMSENMVYGHPVRGQAELDTGIERGQLLLFSLRPEFIQKQRKWYWLRSVYSGVAFCQVDYSGMAGGNTASTTSGVRPYACIYFDDVLT